MTLGTIDDKEEFRQAVRFQLADYTVCVRFPTRRRSCARNQEAEAGTTYVNKIMTSITGWHKVIWSVEGRRFIRAFWRR